jgi:hypothetical protein
VNPRFPHLLRTTRHRWWKPALGLSFACFLVLVLAIPLVLFAMFAASALDPSIPFFSSDSLSPDTPLGLLANNLALAVITPAVLLTVVLVHRQRPGFLSSVTGRLRVALLGRLLLVALGVTLAAYVLTLLLLPASGPDSDWAPDQDTLLALLAVIVLTTPLQAAAEEYGFRGYLTQALASWFRGATLGAVSAAVVTALLFALAHGVQDPWLFADRMVFGLVASWLVWRTGGLEGAIALHAANNLVALTSAAVTGDLKTALTSTSVDWPYAVADIVTLLLFAGLTTWLARRWNVAVVSDATAVGYPQRRLDQPVSADT